MLGVDKGVMVATDRRAGNTLSKAVSDATSKILPIHPYGMVTGCGLASLVEEGGEIIRVDLFKMFRRICHSPQFRFTPEDFKAVCNAWRAEMLEHLSKCEPRYWPETPECGYWFKPIFVFEKSGLIEAWMLKFEYRLQNGQPDFQAACASIDDKYVNGGHLLMEGDQRGGEYLDKEPADSPLLPETHKAWKAGLNPTGISAEYGARILKDALYVNHVHSTRPDGEMGVGPTCDLAFIDRQVGFRWYQRDVSTRPEGLVGQRY